MGLHPQQSNRYTTFDLSSLEKEDFKGGIQVLIFLLVNIICSFVKLRTLVVDVEAVQGAPADPHLLR